MQRWRSSFLPSLLHGFGGGLGGGRSRSFASSRSGFRCYYGWSSPRWSHKCRGGSPEDIKYVGGVSFFHTFFLFFFSPSTGAAALEVCFSAFAPSVDLVGALEAVKEEALPAVEAVWVPWCEGFGGARGAF